MLKDKLPAFGGIITAILSASCCLGPLLFIVFGITGLGFMAKIAWLRPYFIILTLIFIAASFHFAYGKGSSCMKAGACSPAVRTMNRVLFWVLVVFTIIGVTFPYIITLVFN